MSKFSERMKNNPPALIIKYTRGETRDQDTYQWGVRGKMPSLQLIGMIVRVQAELQFRNPDKCDEDMLVIVFNESTGKMDWFVSPSIPVDELVGNLELIKASLVDGRLAAAAQNAQREQQTGIVGVDGRPISGKSIIR